MRVVDLRCQAVVPRLKHLKEEATFKCHRQVEIEAQDICIILSCSHFTHTQGLWSVHQHIGQTMAGSMRMWGPRVEPTSLRCAVL